MAIPPKVKRNLRMKEELWERVDALADKEELSSNAVLVQAVENWLTYRERHYAEKGKKARRSASRVIVEQAGVPVAVYHQPSAGVYAPCPCGSGQKWKFCHGRN